MFTHTLQIFKKELYSYFQSRMAWVVFVIYAAISMGVTFFQSDFLVSSDVVLLSFFRLQSNIFVIIIPALTIKLWADERRQGTLELTTSLPISYTALTLGKYLAVWAFCGLMLLSTCGLWVSMAVLTEIDNLAVLQNYLMCMLLCGAFCAISLCASVFAAHQVSAFVLSLAACMGFLLINFAWLVSSLGFSSEVILRIAGALNFADNFDNLIVGQISFNGIFYFVSLIVFALWLNICVISRSLTAKKHIAEFVGCLAASFVLFNIAVSLLFGSFISDFSQDGRHSLTAETKNWLAQNKGDLFIRLYFSSRVEDKDFLSDVLRLLEQYQLNSDGKLSLHTVKVTPLSTEEAEARKAGIQALPNNMWFGLVASDANGKFAVIPHLNPKRAAYLEHDISRLLSSLGSYQKPTIGIASSDISVMNNGNMFNSKEDWPFVQVLRQYYNLQYINSKTGLIPANIDVLMVINPKNLAPSLIYGIDQYLMRGGSLMIFMDPLSEISLLKYGPADNRSNLQAFLRNLGVIYQDDMVVGDTLHNRPLKLDGKNEPYPFWLNSLPAAADNPLTKGLKPLAINSAGYFMLAEADNLQAEVLYTTSEQSGVADVSYLQYGSLTETIENYSLINQKLPLAVLLQGNFSSVYDYPLTMDNEQPFLSVSIASGKVLLVADSDMLDAKLWNNNVTAQQIYDLEPASGNMDFVERAVDYLSGNKALLNVSPKFAKLTGIPIMKILVYMAQSKYAVEQMETNDKLAEISAQREHIDRMLKLQELIPSLQVTKDIENLELQRIELQQKLRDIEAAIYKNGQIRIALFVAGNFIFQLLIFALYIALCQISRRRLLQQAERIAHV